MVIAEEAIAVVVGRARIHYVEILVWRWAHTIRPYVNLFRQRVLDWSPYHESDLGGGNS